MGNSLKRSESEWSRLLRVVVSLISVRKSLLDESWSVSRQGGKSCPLTLSSTTRVPSRSVAVRPVSLPLF